MEYNSSLFQNPQLNLLGQQTIDTKSEKASLKLNFNKKTSKKKKKTKIKSSGPITSWQIEGEKVETVTAFIFSGSKITADSDCKHEIESHWLLGKKAMTSLDSVLKSRDITLPRKVHSQS